MTAVKRCQFLFPVLLMLLSLHCGPGDDERKDAGVGPETAPPPAAVEDLQVENRRLRQAQNTLETKYELLAGRHEELEEWSRLLVNGYGTGIWYLSKLTLPTFVERIDSDDPRVLVEALNRRFEEDRLPTLAFQGQSGPRVAVRVSPADLLTQRMGSHGARSYINAVLYSLASIRGVECVVFAFEEGDHAQPGEYCKP